MRSLFRILTTIVWALWFGGVMGLFLSVTTLFKADRGLAIQAAPKLFLAFERYQLILAAWALVLTFCWRISLPAVRLTVLFLLFAVATCGAATSAGVITPKIEALRTSNATSSPEFRKLHGLSMCIYVAEAATLLAGGVVISLNKP